MSSRSKTEDHRKLRSVAQEAERLGLSLSYLYGEIRASRFPHIKLGSRVLLDPAEVDAFLSLREVGVEEALSHAEQDNGLR